MTHIVPSIFDTHTILANKRAAQNTILYLTYTLSNDIDSHCTADPSTDPSSTINDHNHCTVDPSIDPFIDPSNTVLLTTLIHPVVGSNAKAHNQIRIMHNPSSDPSTNLIRLIQIHGSNGNPHEPSKIHKLLTASNNHPSDLQSINNIAVAANLPPTSHPDIAMNLTDSNVISLSNVMLHHSTDGCEYARYKHILLDLKTRAGFTPTWSIKHSGRFRTALEYSKLSKTRADFALLWSTSNLATLEQISYCFGVHQLSLTLHCILDLYGEKDSSLFDLKLYPEVPSAQIPAICTTILTPSVQIPAIYTQKHPSNVQISAIYIHNSAPSAQISAICTQNHTSNAQILAIYTHKPTPNAQTSAFYTQNHTSNAQSSAICTHKPTLSDINLHCTCNVFKFNPSLFNPPNLVYKLLKRLFHQTLLCYESHTSIFVNFEDCNLVKTRFLFASQLFCILSIMKFCIATFVSSNL
eukprot:979217_1